MKIKDSDRSNGIILEWKLKGRSKRRLSPNKGIKYEYHSTVVTLPPDLVNLLSNDGRYTYMYEHFETICFFPTEPPETVTYKRLRLNDTSKIPNCSKQMEIPFLFFDAIEMDSAIIKYYPNKKDYISNQQGLITIDTEGYDPRKHFKIINESENGKLGYEYFLNQKNMVEGIVFHQDIKNILSDKLYIYVTDEIHITNIQPTIDHIETTEDKLIEDLHKHNLIEEDTERLNFILTVDEKDPSNNKAPMITISQVKKE